jgi:hypothetical protein
VVPFTAGGATDLSARLMAQLLSQQLGQSFIVVNKAGASGMIGMGSVANAPKDGYTLGWGGNSPMSVAPHLIRNPPYDPLKAFAPVGLADPRPVGGSRFRTCSQGTRLARSRVPDQSARKWLIYLGKDGYTQPRVAIDNWWLPTAYVA